MHRSKAAPTRARQELLPLAGLPWQALLPPARPWQALLPLARPWQALLPMARPWQALLPLTARPWQALLPLGRPWQALVLLARPWQSLLLPLLLLFQWRPALRLPQGPFGQSLQRPISWPPFPDRSA